MAVFLISYDLRKPEYNYEPLYAALKEIKATQLQDSVWGVNSTCSAKEIYDFLWRYMHDQKDRLFVITFDKTQEFYCMNALGKFSEL
jgi:hypothetical protein